LNLIIQAEEMLSSGRKEGRRRRRRKEKLMKVDLEKLDH